MMMSFEYDPNETVNRAGQDEIRYGPREHAVFFARMRAALPAFTVRGANGAAARPLAALAARDADDPAVALLDACAVALDVLAFYRERTLNEGFLRTARERRSLQELARSVGYELKPGVSAAALLAFLVEDARGAPRAVSAPRGTRVRSIPGQNQASQTFETVRDFVARAEWNELRPRVKLPQTFTAHTRSWQVVSPPVPLAPGDPILLLGEAGPEVRILQSADVDLARGVTRLEWDQPVGVNASDPIAPPKFFAFRQKAALFGAAAPEWSALPESERLRFAPTPDAALDLSEWPGFRPGGEFLDLDAVYARILPGSWALVQDGARAIAVPCTDVTVAYRSDFLITAKLTRLSCGDVSSLAGYDPRTATVRLESVELASAPAPVDRTLPVWGDRLELDRLIPGLERGQTLILTGRRSRVRLRRSFSLESLDRSRREEIRAGETLRLIEAPAPDPADASALLWTLETNTGFIGALSLSVEQSPSGWPGAPDNPPGPADPAFDWAPAAADDDASSEALQLKNAYPDSDRTYHILILERPLRGVYDPATTRLNANVVGANHGETVEEALGSGDGALANQSFVLRNPPLTHVSAATATGAKSALEVRVNGMLWEETDSLFGLGPGERKYICRRLSNGATRVQFGDGVHGARLPTGVENVSARYRTGIGRAGEVPADSLRLLQARPLGIRDVTNPLAATGAADPEDRDSARERTPLSTLALGRASSLIDYEAFARVFAGVGKARAAGFQRGEDRIVHITVAGENGAAIEIESALWRNLKAALLAAGPPYQPLELAQASVGYFNIAARLLIEPAADSESVFRAAENNLRERFRFEARAFGQDVSSAEIIATLQATPGVRAADLDQLYPDRTDMEISAALQEDLERDAPLRPNVRLALNDALRPLNFSFSDVAFATEEKAGVRWLVREPEASDGVVLMRDGSRLRMYRFRANVEPFLTARAARETADRILPAELLLLNPLPVGVILMAY